MRGVGDRPAPRQSGLSQPASRCAAPQVVREVVEAMETKALRNANAFLMVGVGPHSHSALPAPSLAPLPRPAGTELPGRVLALPHSPDCLGQGLCVDSPGKAPLRCFPGLSQRPSFALVAVWGFLPA